MLWVPLRARDFPSPLMNWILSVFSSKTCCLQKRSPSSLCFFLGDRRAKVYFGWTGPACLRSLHISEVYQCGRPLTLCRVFLLAPTMSSSGIHSTSCSLGQIHILSLIWTNALFFRMATQPRSLQTIL